MLLHRRDFLITVGATSFLAACASGPPKPSTVTVIATAGPGMNLAPDASERPVTLQLLRLKSLGAFNGAEMFALQADPAAALGADLLGADQLVLAPQGTASKTITFEPEATFLGVVALLRDPSGKTWRASKGIAKEATLTVPIQVGSSGLTL